MSELAKNMVLSGANLTICDDEKAIVSPYDLKNNFLF